jgi:hypothetical protein
MGAYNTSGSIITILPGSSIFVALPSNQILNGFAVDLTSKFFTVSNAGTYYVNYSVNTTTAVLMSTTIIINSIATSQLTLSPTLAGSDFNTSAIVTLFAGDTLSLQLTAGELAITTALASGVGASLNVIRLI